MTRKKKPNLATVEDDLAELVEPEESWIGAAEVQGVVPRVNFIARLMNEGLWDNSARRQCEQEWPDIGKERVKQLATMASHKLNTTINDRAKMAGFVSLRLREIAEQDGPDRAKATELVGKTLGMFRERNTESTPEEQRAHFIGLVQSGAPDVLGALEEALKGASVEIRKQVKGWCA